MKVKDYIQGSELHVGVLVPYPPLERAHGLLGLHRFRANEVGYLEVQGNVLSAEASVGVYSAMCSCSHSAASTYKLDEVARSICSSSALFPDPNQPAMMLRRSRVGRAVYADAPSRTAYYELQNLVGLETSNGGYSERQVLRV